MRRHTRIIGAATVAAAAVIGGTAFTDSVVGVPSSTTLGYGATEVRGAAMRSLTYDLNQARDTIDGVSLVMEGNTSSMELSMLFTGPAPMNTVTPLNCGVPAFRDATAPSDVRNTTAYTCVPVGGYPTSEITKTAIVVTDPSM